MNLDIQKSPVNYNRMKDVLAKYPGLKGDLSNMDYATEQAVNGKKIKGFQFLIPVGVEKYVINLSGTSRQLLGIKFIAPANTTLRATLTINNDIIFRDTFVTLLSTVNNTQQEFFVYLRALSGQDTIDISFESTAGELIKFNIYYI